MITKLNPILTNVNPNNPYLSITFQHHKISTMRNRHIITIVLAAVIIASCSRKVPETVHNIPDHAFLVASMHPKQIYEKGQIGTMESLVGKLDHPVMQQIARDPAASGLDISEYIFMFIYFIDDEPLFGTTAVMKDAAKFTEMVQQLANEEALEIIDHKGYSMITPGSEHAAMAWNEEQLIFVASPAPNFSAEQWQSELITLFDLPREEAVTSIVDFNDFAKKMEDMNVWFTGDELQKILDMSGVTKEMDVQLPMDLKNNYGQIFVEFADGAMYVHSETHFSDEVTKAAETFLVAKDELNSDLIALAPGNDLLMAMAFSLDLDKLTRMMKNFSPPEIDSLSGKMEKMTGIPGNEILEALNGDFVIAVNSASEGNPIPVEILIGIGLDDKTLQDKMMGTVGNMAAVEKEGDFFMINANGMELYSGIVNDVWVITNTPGYKDAVTGKGLEKTLKDSKFSDFANGSMGMYMNLDLSSYPSALQTMAGQGGALGPVRTITESFSYMGVEASNKESNMTLITAHEDENSLYTLLQVLESTGSMHQ